MTIFFLYYIIRRALRLYCLNQFIARFLDKTVNMAAVAARSPRVDFVARTTVARTTGGRQARSRVQNALVDFLAARGLGRGDEDDEDREATANEYDRQYGAYGDLDATLGKILAANLPAYAKQLRAKFDAQAAVLDRSVVAHLDGVLKYAFKLAPKPAGGTRREWLRELLQTHMDSVFQIQMQVLSDLQESVDLRKRLAELDADMGQKKAEGLEMIKLIVRGDMLR